MEMEGIYDQRLPKSLQTIDPNDIPNNSTVSIDTVKLLLGQLNALIEQIPVVNPPTFIPRQSLSRTVESDLTELMGQNNKTVDAGTSTQSNSNQQPPNQPCYYLVPQKNDSYI